MKNYYSIYRLIDEKVIVITSEANTYILSEYGNLRRQLKDVNRTKIILEDLKRDNFLNVTETEDGLVISLKDHIPYEFNGCVREEAVGNITLRRLERALTLYDRIRDARFKAANISDLELVLN